jgi:hypothetical protein
VEKPGRPADHPRPKTKHHTKDQLYWPGHPSGASRLSRQVLWNGNLEPPLWTILTDREHIVRWAWTTHGKPATRVAALLEEVLEGLCY